MKEFAVHGELTERIICAAIEVHRHLGPGLLESVYERALRIEFRSRSIAHACQPILPVQYKGEPIANCRPDLIVEGLVVVEIKSVERFDEVFVAQMLTYLRVTGLRLGLIVNFNRALLTHGIKRVIL